MIKNMSQYNDTPIIQFKKMPTGGSDATLKKHVTPLSNALQKVIALRPVTWFWKEDRENKELQYGFIAQEVEEVLPHLVSNDTWSDGTTRKFLAASEMTPYLVRAISEQNEEVTQLHTQVAALLTSIKKQQEEIAQLKHRLKQK